MFALDLFNTDHERRLAEGAVDQLEQRRIDDLAMKMDDLVARAKKADTPEARAALVKEFQKCKAERDSYYKIKDECMGYGTLTGEGQTTPTTTGLHHRGTKGYGADYSDSGVEFAKQKYHGDLNKVDKPLTKSLEKGMDVDFDEAGIPGNIPVEKIPGKEDLLKGRGRSYYENSQKKNSKTVVEYISMGSDKNYIEAEPYKNYKIYVRKKPFGNTGMYTAHTEIDRKEFMGKGSSQEEAIQAIRDRIDFVLNAQKKVTGSSTIDFNVKFATDLLADPKQAFYAKLENINGQPKLIIASPEVAGDPELLAAGDFKRSALRNQVDDEGRATPLPGIPLTAKSLRSGDWIANGRYTIGNETTDRDGNRVFDLTYHSTAHTKSDKLRLNQPAFTLGTTREVDEEGSPIASARRGGQRDNLARARHTTYYGAIDEGRMGEIDAQRQDLERMTDRQFMAAYGMSKQAFEHRYRTLLKPALDEARLAVGDPIVVKAPNEFEGKTGEIAEFSPSGTFVVVDLYNHGEHSMHLSDVEFNQFAADQEEDDWYDDGAENTLEEAGTRAGALNTAQQLYKAIQSSKGKPQHEIDLLQRQLNALARKYQLKPEEYTAGANQQQAGGQQQRQQPPPPPPPPGGQQAGQQNANQQGNWWQQQYEKHYGQNAQQQQQANPDNIWNPQWAAKQQAAYRANGGKGLDPNWAQQHMDASAKMMQANQADMNKMMQSQMASGPWNMPGAKMAEDEVDEGFQDFNKVEPYEVCLAGRPVKQFDYYEDARRFHDNWKKKLYREGDKDKADKITLNPVMKEQGVAEGQATRTCPQCDGSGEDTLDPTKSCRRCGGKGHIPMSPREQGVAEDAGDYKVYYMTAEDHKLMGRYASREKAEQRLNQLQSKYPDNKFIIWTNSKQGVAEAGSPAQQAAIAIAMKTAGKKPKSVDENTVQIPHKGKMVSGRVVRKDPVSGDYIVDVGEYGSVRVPAHKVKQGMAEGEDQVKKVFKDKSGKPVGEIGIDPESSPGNGEWYVHHYATGYSVVGFDSAAEAKRELMYVHKHPDAVEGHPSTKEQGVAEMDKSQRPPSRHGDYPLGAKGTTVKPTTPKKVVKDLTKVLDKAFDTKEVKEADGDFRTVIRKVMSKVFVDGGGGNLSYMISQKAPTMDMLRDVYHDDLDRMLTKAHPNELKKAAAELSAMFSKQVDEDTGSWIVYDPETKQIKKRFKTHTAGKSYARTHNLGFASSEFYFDRVKDNKEVAETTAFLTRGPRLSYGTQAQHTTLGPVQVEKNMPDGSVVVHCERDGKKYRTQPSSLKVAVAETVTDIKSEMAKVYRRLAPKIERHRDSFLAGQLYDELENIAELHGAEAEFKRMMAGARNRAHMDYDTNPGGFQNWFWYLPFGDNELAEESTTSTDAVERAILNRIMVANTDLLMKFGPDKVMQAAEEVAYNVGDVDEIGTSDVSAYVNQVRQILGVEA